MSVSDYAQADYRELLDIGTGRPSVSYVITARIGNVLFEVSGTDHDAQIGPHLWPVGYAMWGEAQRVIELLISRYQQLQ